MADATTIKLSHETKAALEEEQLDGETFDDTVSRLVGTSDGQIWTEGEIEAIAERVFERKARERR